MKWITRERPKIDRIACPWLIARFIDDTPEFLRGARFCSAYSQYRPVHGKRREVRLPAFFRFRLFRKTLRRTARCSGALCFVRVRPGCGRHPDGLSRTPESPSKTLELSR